MTEEERRMCFACCADQPEFMERHGLEQVQRFTEAVALGAIADEEFALACVHHRLSPILAILAPLDWLVMASAEPGSEVAH